MTPQVKSLGLATMMNVVEKERNVPMMRTQLSSRLHARTTGVFQNFQSTPACTVHTPVSIQRILSFTGCNGGHDEASAGEEERAERPGVGVVEVGLRGEDAVLGVGGVPDVLHRALGALKLRLDVLRVVTRLVQNRLMTIVSRNTQHLAVPTTAVIEPVRDLDFIFLACFLIALDKVFHQTPIPNCPFKVRI